MLYKLNSLGVDSARPTRKGSDRSKLRHSEGASLISRGSLPDHTLCVILDGTVSADMLSQASTCRCLRVV